MFFGFAIKTLRDEAPLHAASTPTVEAVLSAGYNKDVGKCAEAMTCTPRLGLRGGFAVVLSGRCGITANLIFSLRTEIRQVSPLSGLGQSPTLGVGILFIKIERTGNDLLHRKY